MIGKFLKKINLGYARYLQSKRADRYTTSDEESYAQKHSQRVNSLKRSILRLVILLVILLIVWPMVHGIFTGSSKISLQKNDAKNKEKKAENTVPVMMKPRLYGYDENNQPYNITADSSVSISETKMILTNLNGEMSLKDNSRIKIHSEKGDYAVKKKEMALNNGVKIITEKNYEFVTKSAYIKFNENTATGSEKVNITGALGDIEAHGFIIRNSGDEIFLFGGTNLDAIINDKDFDRLEGLKGKPGEPKTGIIDLKSAIQPKRGEPINIKSDSLTIKNNENTAIFNKAVHVTQGKMILNSDEMELYTETDKKDGKSSFKIIKANGNVDFQSLDKAASSQHAVYDVKSGILILTENVKMSDGENSLEGKYFRYNVKTGVGELRNLSDLSREKKSTDSKDAPKGRVKAVFTPGTEQNMQLPFVDKINKFKLETPDVGMGNSKFKVNEQPDPSVKEPANPLDQFENTKQKK